MITAPGTTTALARPVTYDLRGSTGNSDSFYRGLPLFVDALLRRVSAETGTTVRRYRDFVVSTRAERARSIEEYLFDLMSVGVLWREYGRAAGSLSRIEAAVLHAVYEMRTVNRVLKKRVIDPIRGILGTLWLRKDRASATPIRRRSLEALWRWMRAGGDLSQDAKRLAFLIRYIGRVGPSERLRVYAAIAELADLFVRGYRSFFGPFTAHVDGYAERARARRRWREDYLLCTRFERDYALSLVGAQIMNRAMKDDFASTVEKHVLLPACMRSKPDGLCHAKRHGHYLECVGCDRTCAVDRVRRRGKDGAVRFAVRIVPHSSDFSAWLKTWAVGRGVGVVGVACPLHLMPGGLELRRLGIASQCVFLDYCGCRAHWHHRGIATDINDHRLDDVMGTPSERA